jgi:L-malate glycosyltransferase
MEDSRIKIAFLANDLGVGGVQRLVVDFARMFDKDKFHITVLTLLDTKDGEFYKSELGEHASYYAMKMKNPWQFSGWLAVYRFFKKEKPDIVFTQLFVADTIGRITAKLARVPLIVTEIQNVIPGLPKRYILIDRLLAKITDICVSTAQAVTDYARNVIHFPERKMRIVLTNAVDHYRFQTPPDRKTFRNEFSLSENAKVIVTIGRLVEQKGHIHLIRALPDVIKEIPNAYVLMVGDGYLKEKLEEETKRLELEDRVLFLGFRKDTPQLLMGSDVFAFPSVWEGQGLILFEAFFSKIPIVASNTGGIPEVVIHEETGLLAPPGEPQELAKALIRMLKDDSLQTRVTSEAYTRFQNRTLENSIRSLETMLETELRKKRGETRVHQY